MKASDFRSKAKRHELYKRMLDAAPDEDLVGGGMGTYGLCDLLHSFVGGLFDYYHAIQYFPELIDQTPAEKSVCGYWWYPGQWAPRREALRIAILNSRDKRTN